MYVTHFVYQFICHGHLGFFQPLTVVSNATTTFVYKCLLSPCFQFFCIYTQVELLDHMVIIFLRNHRIVFHSGCTILHFCQQWTAGSSFSISFPKLSIVIIDFFFFFDNSYSHGLGFPGGSDGKESICNAGDPGVIPGSGRSPGKGNGNAFQYSCLENCMDWGACWATVHGVGKSQTDWVANISFISFSW